MTNFIPTNSAEFLGFTKVIVDRLEEKFAELIIPTLPGQTSPLNWHFMNGPLFKELKDAYNKFIVAHENAKQTNSTANVRERQRTQKEAERLLRKFINQFLRQDPVTDKDRDMMKIPNRKQTRTANIDVVERVEFVIRIGNTQELIIDFRVAGSDSRKKPTGYKGAYLIYSIGENQPKSYSECSNTLMATRSPFRITFDKEHRGKTVWIAMCWQNARGNRGTFSKFKGHMVP